MTISAKEGRLGLSYFLYEQVTTRNITKNEKNQEVLVLQKGTGKSIEYEN